ncbi:MAG: GGDEF domain-containing protein, partial [Psychromonas sp.]
AILSIIRASELMSINSRQGFQQGDLYLENLSGIITKVTSQFENISIYRINGTDFALIAEEMSISDAKRLADELKMQFDQYQAQHDLDSMAYNGISSIISGQLPEQVLARTDMALAKAQSEGVNSWSFQYHNDVDSLFGEKHWHVIVDRIIDQKGITLLHQPILAIHKDMKGYEEIFTRFITDNDQTIPTDTVFAMAQRIDKIVKLEQIIIEKVVGQCRNKKDNDSRWGINISSTAIQNSSFIVWLERLLLREPTVAASLIFEMEEALLDINLVASKRVFDMLRRTGTRSAISNFGKGIGSFSLFKTLKPDFIKIDTVLISDIERDNANQQFVRMIIDVAHRMGCRVIAEGVEHLEQKQILETMYVDGIQGFLIARPTPF